MAVYFMDNRLIKYNIDRNDRIKQNKLKKKDLDDSILINSSDDENDEKNIIQNMPEPLTSY